MSKNIGTLVTAAIRPNDSNDPIASAFAYEIKGGLHTQADIIDRDSIISERREWGMMCYVINDNATYQLKYNHVDTNIMNNLNWVEFTGNGSGEQWIDSVLSIEFQPPATYSVGDRFLAGTSQNDSLIGGWVSFNPGVVLEWNSANWETTTPTDGMSVRVNNKDNIIYKYEGTFPTGYWNEEKTGQIRSIDASSNNGQTYSAVSSPDFDNYVKDMMFLTNFNQPNAGATVSISINSMGFVNIKKPSSSGLIDLVAGDIVPNITYSLIYNGSVFELVKHYTGDNTLNTRYFIESGQHVVVPPYHQYWVYGNLTLVGEMTNYGQVVIANGSLINSSNFYNYGDLYFIQFNAGTASGGLINLGTQSGLTFSQGDLNINVDNQTIMINQQNQLYSNINTGNGLTVSSNIISLADTSVISGTYGSTSSVATFTVDQQGRLTMAGESTISITSSQISDFASAVNDEIFNNNNFINSDTINFDVATGSSVSLDVIVNPTSGLTISFDGVNINYGNGLTVSGEQLIVDSSIFGIQYADNGLSVDGLSNVLLGGTLSQNTDIYGNNKDLTISDVKSMTLESDILYLDFDSATFSGVNYLGITAPSLNISSGIFLYNDTSISPDGIKYATSGYVTSDRSLTDKEYVDSLFGGLTASINEVVAGVGLTGGGTSSVVTLSIGDGPGIRLNNDSIEVEITNQGGLTFSQPGELGTLEVEVDGSTINIVDGALKVVMPIELQVAASDETTPISTGTAKVTFRSPCDISVTEVRSSLTTADTAIDVISSIEVAGSPFCTNLTIDAGDRTSVGSATAYTLSSPAIINDDDEIVVNIDQAGVEGTGLKVTIIGNRI